MATLTANGSVYSEFSPDFRQERPAQLSPAKRAEIIAQQEADAAANEPRRLLLRQEIRKQIAASKLAEQRYLDLSAAIAEAEATCDRLADEHSRACAPLQAEIKAIDGKQVDRAVAGELVDAKLNRRRSELVALIAAENTKLEEALRPQQQVIAELTTQRAAAANEVDPTHAMRLGQQGNPAWVAELHVMTTFETWARRLVEKIAEANQLDRNNRLRLRAAQEVLGLASRRVAEINQRIMDE
jgi:hypothetical protein